MPARPSNPPLPFRLFPPALLLTALVSSAVSTHAADAPHEQQAAKDAVVVETLLRLPGFDIDSAPKAKAALLRHLDRIEDTDRFVELIGRFHIRDRNERLLQLVLSNPSSTGGVNATKLLLQFGEGARLSQTIDSPEQQTATKAIDALGFVGSQPALELLSPLVTDTARAVSLRSAVVRGAGRSRNGERTLLGIVQDGNLPVDMNFSAANVLHASRDKAIRGEAAKYLKLPVTVSSLPLPPVVQLVKMKGDAKRGKQVFATTGTCAKCHMVDNEGKEVGPNLSEIGGKLSREAMYVSILDPSAGISHNYETYTAALDDGNVVTGILVSDTEDQVTLKTAEAIVHKIDKSSIEEFKKQSVSMMPTDLQKTMTAEQLADVVQYLTTLKKK